MLPPSVWGGWWGGDFRGPWPVGSTHPWGGADCFFDCRACRTSDVLLLCPSGGTVAFIDKAFRPGLFTGAMNVLLWISYIVMLSLYTYAFGSYGSTLFPEGSQLAWKHILISGSILSITGLNLLSARVIGEVEDWIVAAKVAIFLLFVVTGAVNIDGNRLLPAQWPSPIKIIAGGMIIFLAYEGFELIANTAQDVQNPGQTLPRAFYSAVGFVICLYILVSVVATGNLSVDKIVEAKDYALAAAARPFLGRFGYGYR